MSDYFPAPIRGAKAASDDQAKGENAEEAQKIVIEVMATVSFESVPWYPK